MSLTLNDIRDRLMKLDEVTLLEILEISSEDIIERFMDKVEEKTYYLEGDLEDADIE